MKIEIAYNEIKAYLEKFSFYEICEFSIAIKKNFIIIKIQGQETKDYYKYSEHWQKLISIISMRLFSRSDEFGFPDAQKFVSVYMPGCSNAEIKTIIEYFINQRIDSVKGL